MPDDGNKPGSKGGEKKPDWVDSEPFVPASSSSGSPAKPKPATSAGTIEPKVQVSADAPASAATPRSYDEGPDTDHGPPRRRFWGLPAWGWLLVIATGCGVLLLTCDLRNRNRYLLFCSAHKVSLRKGRTLPLPFGEVTIGGPEFRPIEIPPEADCHTRVYFSEEEAERAFLHKLLEQVRTALDNPGTANLTRARQQVEQALLLTRKHRRRRKETQRMLAELLYREGRSGLARVENELRKALALFQRVQKLDAERWEDLDDWITHLEDLLRTVSPSPGGSVPRAVTPLPSTGARRPLVPPSAKGLPLPLSPPASAPSTSPDAGLPSTGGGILM